MDITPSYLHGDYTHTVTPSQPRPEGGGDFAQNMRNAAGQTDQRQAAPELQPRAVREPTYENMRAQAGALPGVTPLTPGELDMRQTVSEMRVRQLIGRMAGRMTAPANIADYPLANVSYAGYLAAQVNHAGFALPDSPYRLSTPRRGTDMQSVKPVEGHSSAVRGQRVEAGL